jgi:hypothetical protein
MKVDQSRLGALRDEKDVRRIAALKANERVLDVQYARDAAAQRLEDVRRNAATGWAGVKDRAARELPFFEEQLRKAEAELAGARQDAVIAGERYDAAAMLLSNCERYVSQGA